MKIITALRSTKLLCIALLMASSTAWAQSTEQNTQNTEASAASQAAVSQVTPPVTQEPVVETIKKNYPKVKIKTNLGDIVIELYDDKAPKTVENFLRYVKKGYYNKTIFHRVIDNFMVQGGGMDAKLNEKPTDPPVVNEAKMAFERGLKNEIGTIAMARLEDPNSARAQFYINVNNNDFLDYQALADGDPVAIMRNGSSMNLPRRKAMILAAGYTPFGKVTEGWETVEKIKSAPNSPLGIHQNVPNKPITILSIQLLKK